MHYYERVIFDCAKYLFLRGLQFDVSNFQVLAPHSGESSYSTYWAPSPKSCSRRLSNPLAKQS
jgi:hypothetical protein